MFTLEQIKRIHSNVKSGADFPQYVQDLKQLGLVSYDHYVADGHDEYLGTGNFILASEPTGIPLPIAAYGQPDRVEHAIHSHQRGQTDYLIFCQQVAEAGAEKWTVDAVNMTCTYYDQQGQALVVEPIPLP